MLYIAQTTRCQTKVISEQNGERCGRKRQGSGFRYYGGTCLKGKLSQDKQCPGQDMSLGLQNTRQK